MHEVRRGELGNIAKREKFAQLDNESRAEVIRNIDISPPR